MEGRTTLFFGPFWTQFWADFGLNLGQHRTVMKTYKHVHMNSHTDRWKRGQPYFIDTFRSKHKKQGEEIRGMVISLGD